MVKSNVPLLNEILLGVALQEGIQVMDFSCTYSIIKRMGLPVAIVSIHKTIQTSVECSITVITGHCTTYHALLHRSRSIMNTKRFNPNHLPFSWWEPIILTSSPTVSLLHDRSSVRSNIFSAYLGTYLPFVPTHGPQFLP